MERETEKYLRRILEAKEERSSISTKSKKLKTEHSETIKRLIHLMKSNNVECVDLSSRDQASIGLLNTEEKDKHLYMKLVSFSDREPKVMPRHVNLFAKQWYESKDSCIAELRDTMNDFLRNVSKHLEDFDN